MAIIACDTITLTDMTDVSKCTPYFKSQSAQSAAPDKPNAVPPTGWSTTEPGYDASKVVYICWLTEYSNGTFDYSDVSLMSSYTGAIEAWNKADNAQNAINNLEIGGRNILRNTADYVPEWALGSGASFSYGVATLTGSSSNYYSVIHSPKYDADEIYNGDTYVLSFEYKCDIACAVQPVIAASSAAITNLTSWTRTKYVNWISGTQPTLPATNGAWVKYVFGARTISKSNLTSGSGDIVTGFIQIYARTNNANIQIRHIKLERGNLATEWTPAPEDALAEEQTIYISKASGTNTVSENTTWVTVSSDSQNTWTTKRPTYSSSYPVLFIAKQSKTVGGRISCTTPLKDDTTTIIDGGHIITGTIDATAIISNSITANQIATGAIKADELDTNAVTAAKIASNAVTADKIAAGAITIGKIDSTDTSTASAILNSEIDVGGRNLLPVSVFSMSQATGGPDQISGDGYITDSTPTSDSRTWSYANSEWKISLDPGTYILSWDTKVTTSNSNVGLHLYDSNNQGLVNVGNTAFSVTGKKSEMCTISTSTDVGLMVKIYEAVVRFKLEKGNVATDWTPAPEDIDNSIRESSTEYIVGTQTAITGSWTGVTKDSSLYVGKTIAYKLPYAGNGNASLTLTLSDGTTTSAIAVYSMTTRVTTHYPAGSIIQMTYDGTYWRTTGWYNTNNYDRVLHNNYVLAATAVTSGALVCGTAGGYKQVAASVPFDLSYPILWAGGAWTSNTQYANAYESYPGVNPTTTGTVQSIAVNKMVYLKGTVVGNTFTCTVNNFLTCVVPSTADGFYYIPVGVVANDSTSKMYFSSSKELYAYVDGYFGVVSIREASAAAKKATNYITDITNSGIFVHTVDSPTPTTPLTTGNYGVHINGTDIGIIRNGVNVASYGDTIRVGKTSNHHIVLDSTGMAVVKNGLEFARFSDTIKLGRQNYSAQAEFGSSGLVFKNLQNEEIATIRANANPLDPTLASLTGKSYPESVFAITSSTATALAYTKLELYNIVFESPYTVDTKLDYTGFAIVSTEDSMTNPSEVWYHIKNSANSNIFTVTDLSTIDSSYTGTRTDVHCDYGSIVLSAPSTSRTITKTGILVKNEMVNGVRTETEVGNVSVSISIVFESANNNIKFGMSITGLPTDIYEADYSVKKHCTDKGDGIGYITVTCKYTKVSGYEPEYVFGLKTANQDYQSYAFMTGRDVYANASEQFITGRFNDPDGTHAFEIGNGTDSANRSNAFSVGWDGNVDCNSLTSPSLSTQNLTASAGSLAGINMTRFFYPVSYSSFTSCAALPQNSVIRIPSAAAAAKYSDLPENQAQVIMTFGTTDNSSGADNNRCVQVSIRNSLSMWVRGHGAGTAWGAWREVALQVPTSESGHWKQPSVVSSSCTIRNGGYYVEGKHVYVQLEIRVSSTLAANTNLDVLTGFPGPPFRILLPANTSGAYGNADVSTGGAMRIRLSAQTGTSTSILIVGSYAIST